MEIILSAVIISGSECVLTPVGFDEEEVKHIKKILTVE